MTVAAVHPACYWSVFASEIVFVQSPVNTPGRSPTNLCEEAETVYRKHIGSSIQRVYGASPIGL